MTEKSDERKEMRSQRHDFIKEYYRMATMDLDRHLKAGWQTIAVLAGGAAILAAGQDGKIGLPVATTLALISAIWGALTVIDSNYWSLRAIGFLSNVESFYFSVEDRRYFNPYIGYHPEYKLLNSLRYMFWLCLTFGLIAFLSLLWKVTYTYPLAWMIAQRAESLPPLRFLLWSLPVLVAAWGSVWMHYVWSRRLADYIDFTSGSPGPGVRTKAADLRHVTLEPPAGNGAPALEADTHASVLASLHRRNQRVLGVAWIPWGLAIVLTVGCLFRAALPA